MRSRVNVLLVGHDASRTGAPTAGLAWLRWARRHDAATVQVMLAAGGPLLADFRQQAPTTVAGPWLAASASAASHGSESTPALISRSVQMATAQVMGARLRHKKCTIVVANTTAAWALAAMVRRRRRLVLWLHELDHTIDRIMSTGQRRRLLNETDHIIAVGPAVATMVTDRWNVPAAKVTEVPSFVDEPSLATRQPLGTHDLVAIGSLTARKAPEVFVAVVAEVARHRPHTRAAWVGGPLDGPAARLMRSDLADADLTALVDLPGAVPDARSWLPHSGVLIHVAREDPAPLAVLEAATIRVPVVTWESGGASDLANSAGRPDLNLAVGDVAAMARRSIALLEDRTDRERAGTALAHSAANRTTRLIAPRVHSAILGISP